MASSIPDLDSIEYLWGHLKRKLSEYDEPPTSIQELWTRVQKEWDDIGVEECRNLIKSMPGGVEAVTDTGTLGDTHVVFSLLVYAKLSLVKGYWVWS